jgi:hypothetical protein
MGTGALGSVIEAPEGAAPSGARRLALVAVLIAAGAMMLVPATVSVIAVSDPGALDPAPIWLGRAANLVSYLDYGRVPLLVFCVIKVLRSAEHTQ